VDLLQFLLVLAVLGAAVFVITGPLRRPPPGEREAEDRGEAALEAAKEAKYREIRDAELDREMGKLSREDWHAVDRELRAEAIEILQKLDRLEGRKVG